MCQGREGLGNKFILHGVRCAGGNCGGCVRNQFPGTSTLERVCSPLLWRHGWLWDIVCSWLQGTRLAVLVFSQLEHFNGRVEEEEGVMEDA